MSARAHQYSIPLLSSTAHPTTLIRWLMERSSLYCAKMPPLYLQTHTCSLRRVIRVKVMPFGLINALAHPWMHLSMGHLERTSAFPSKHRNRSQLFLEVPDEARAHLSRATVALMAHVMGPCALISAIMSLRPETRPCSATTSRS